MYLNLRFVKELSLELNIKIQNSKVKTQIIKVKTHYNIKNKEKYFLWN